MKVSNNGADSIDAMDGENLQMQEGHTGRCPEPEVDPAEANAITIRLQQMTRDEVADDDGLDEYH